MALEIGGLYFFMPVFSFLFVFLVVFGVLTKTKVLGGAAAANVIVSFIVAVIFMSFSSLELYVRSVLPWLITLVIIVVIVLVIAGVTTKDLGWIMKPGIGWVIVVIVVIVFFVAAIKVFNPVFHPDLVITEGEEGGVTIMEQFKDFFGTSKWAGSILLLIIAILVGWFIMRGGG